MYTSSPATRRRNKLLALAVGAIPFSLCSSAWANRFWKNSVTNGSWAVAADWSATSATGTDTGGVPGASDIAYIANTTNTPFMILLNESDTITGLVLDNTGGTSGTDVMSQTSAYSLAVTGIEYVGYNGNGQFDQSAGADTVGTSSSPQDLILGNNTSTRGTYSMSNSASLTVNGAEVLGWQGTGVFTQSGGSNVIGTTSSPQFLAIGYRADSAGEYDLYSGTLTVNGSEYLGDAGAGYFNQYGGVHIVGTPASQQNLYLGYANSDQNSLGEYELDAGTLTVNGNVYVGGSDTGVGSPSDLSVDGGSVSISGTLKVWPNSGTVIGLDGGQLSVGSLDTSGFPSSFDWVDGTLTFLNGLTVNSSFVLGSSITLGTGLTLGSGSNFVNSGTITLSGGAITAAGTLTNSSMITGYGTISAAAAVNNNQIAQSGGNLFFNSSTSPFVNNDDIVLASGYQLTLNGAGLTNHGTVQLANATVNGSGTFTNAADGIINGPGQIQSPFSNLGTLYLTSGQTNVPAFTNGGVINLTSGGANLGGGQMIINSATIQGYGLVSSPVTNNGRVTPIGGELVFTGAFTNSASGSIQIATGSTVLMQGASNFPTNAGAINLTGGQFDNGGGLLTNIGTISGRGSVTTGGLTNSGTLSLSGGFTDVYGAVTNTGRITVTGGSTATFYNNLNTSAGTFTVTTASTAVFFGTVTGQSQFTGAGTVDFEGNSAGGALANITGNLVVGSSAIVSANYLQENNTQVYGSLSVNSNGTSAAVSTINSLTLAGGTFDLKNNDLIVTNGSNVGSQIAAAYHSGAWNGEGITSSSALNHTGYNLGYATAGTGTGSLNISTFDGQPVSSGTTMVKYTLSGDLNLDNTVDQNDIALLAPNYGMSSGASWYRGDVNHDGAVDQNDIALIAPNYGQTANAPGNALTPGIKSALTRSASPNFSSSGLSGGVSSALNHLYTWDAALPDATAGNVIIKVDNTTGDSHFGDVILQGNSATLYTLVITSASGNMNSGRYDSLNAQYNGGGGSEAATLQGLAVDNTTNHSGNFSVFSQTQNKINEAGLGVTLDFTNNAESVDLSTKANNKNLFSGITADLAFSWSGQNGTLVSGAVEYSVTPEPGMLGMLGVGGVMMLRRRRRSR